ncbi:hypothetical protein N8851_05420 [Schleiferiaceae bacterium]|nr:hypothetical protein [Schleiferiaceae bacterium]
MEDKKRVFSNRVKTARSLARLISFFLFFPFYFPPMLSFYFAVNKGEILMDIEANYIGKLKSVNLRFLDLFVYNSYFRILYYHRLSLPVAQILRLLYPGNKTFFISYHTSIGGGLKLSHPFATIVNAKSIGTNCQIRQCTTIGNKDNDDQKPTIGNSVILGANVNVVGRITIGNHTTIGAGTTVAKDVGDHITAVGAKIRYI